MSEVNEKTPLLEVRNLRKLFPGKRGDFQLFSVQIFQRKGKAASMLLYSSN